MAGGKIGAGVATIGRDLGRAAGMRPAEGATGGGVAGRGSVYAAPAVIRILPSPGFYDSMMTVSASVRTVPAMLA